MEDILNNAKIEMKSVQQTPDMWNEIHSEITKDKQTVFALIFERLFEHKLIYATAFAVVFLFISFTISEIQNHGLISISKAEKLANKIDEEVFDAQKKYEDVIAKMEENCSITELTSENNLAQAYFDKLYLLDQMILVCKSSLENNPYNSQIHKQLFFAYNEKINVYKELQILNERELL